MIIDIHNHTLYGVDDGPATIEESIKMLQNAKDQGIEAMVLTPHYRRGMFPYKLEIVDNNFDALTQKSQDLGISLYLGCEYHMDDMAADNFDSGRCHAMAGGEYVLCEYKYETPFGYIESNTYTLLSSGYVPIIAHAERYKCITSKPGLCDKLINMGALIQINADSVLGLTGFRDKSFCKKLLKNKLVNFIASDAHGLNQRANHMHQAYDYIAAKYDEDYARQLFHDNPLKIIL